MMRNFSRINKSTSCVTSIFQKTSIRLKILDRNALLGKCTAAIFSVIVDFVQHLEAVFDVIIRKVYCRPGAVGQNYFVLWAVAKPARHLVMQMQI